jgi:MFS superfamily sulfate permease-like transporter
MDRRAIFFLGAAVLCALLIPFTPEEFHYVPIWLIGLLLLLAVLSFLDDRGRRAGR